MLPVEFTTLGAPPLWEEVHYRRIYTLGAPPLGNTSTLRAPLLQEYLHSGSTSTMEVPSLAPASAWFQRTKRWSNWLSSEAAPTHTSNTDQLTEPTKG